VINGLFLHFLFLGVACYVPYFSDALDMRPAFADISAGSPQHSSDSL
jgi:hypothetical protein